MRPMLLVLVLLVPVAPVTADVISTSKMKVGDVGQLSVPPKGFIISEVGNDWIAVRFRTLEDTTSIILIRGIPTTGLVDDRQWLPKGNFKVEKTEKYKDKTVFVLQAQKD